MISDYTLSVLDECDKDTLHRICQELLQLREEKRKAKLKRWEGVPEWARWMATDRDDTTWAYEGKTDLLTGANGPVWDGLCASI